MKLIFTENLTTVIYPPTMSQRVSDAFNRRIGCGEIVDETGPRCKAVVRRFLRSPSFTCAHYRCDKTAFLSMLGIAGSTVLAQTVLTLRSAVLGVRQLHANQAERNRIYAVTGKNRIITACFGAIAISEFVFGLYVTALAAQGGEPLTKFHPQHLPISILQRNSPHRFHLMLIGYAFSYDTGPWKLVWSPYLSCLVRDLPCSFILEETPTPVTPQTFWPSRSSFFSCCGRPYTSSRYPACSGL